MIRKNQVYKSKRNSNQVKVIKTTKGVVHYELISPSALAGLVWNMDKESFLEIYENY